MGRGSIPYICDQLSCGGACNSSNNRDEGIPVDEMVQQVYQILLPSRRSHRLWLRCLRSNDLSNLHLRIQFV
ncbi:hypothetical protein Ddye_021532 [Dipteronia dyeriana]|uniref:Uncharacterized protein n=1 Tax=Dipteronia dyeriana TaxID=168575 RepID=A0AAD9WXT8_9ROSI|nr:hypothetical protein Ddye_021532 [Dipteronia dyeriana]